MLGKMYQVQVNTKVIPKTKPARILIYKFTPEGCWVYDAQGKRLATGKPTTRPSTTRQSATRQSSNRAAAGAATQPATNAASAAPR
jgi:hypothetical protein